MKLIVQFILTISLTCLLQWYFPWYMAALAGFTGALVAKGSKWITFLVGFSAVFLVWGTYALFIDIQNASILSAKIAKLFYVQKPAILIFTTALIGGITGGLGAWIGVELKSIIRQKQL